MFPGSESISMYLLWISKVLLAVDSAFNFKYKVPCFLVLDTCLKTFYAPNRL